MIDVARVAAESLDRLVPEPAASPDWRDVERRARGPLGRRRVVAGVAILAAAAFVAVALAESLGGFSSWLSGEPGSPATPSEQRAFDRATRSWVGFPTDTKLRRLARTTTGGATYTLFGFRGAGSLCVRLEVAGAESSRSLACAPLSELRAGARPALVLVADYGVGAGRTAPGPFPIPTPKALVTFGVVADGVRDVTVRRSDGTTARAIVGGDAFLSVDGAPGPTERVTRIAAGGVPVPFAPVPTALFAWAPPTSPRRQPAGPAGVERAVHGGAIRWLARREPRGVGVPATVHHVLAPGVVFAREIAPDPSAPERMVVSVRPAGGVYGGRLRDPLQVCAELVGGRYRGGGCWPGGRLFSTAPFAWGVGEAGSSSQYVTIAGLASDDVARLALFAASGRRVAVPVHDNGYAVEAAKADYPLRLVGYDGAGRVIGVATFRGDVRPLAPHPAANATWRLLARPDGIQIWTAPASGGGLCTAIRFAAGGEQVGCRPALRPDGLDYAAVRDGARSQVVVRAGTAIDRVVLHLGAGRTRTLVPASGFAVARVAAPVSDVVGLDASGRAVATQHVGVVRLTGGAGKIVRLGTTIAVGRSACAVGAGSPPLGRFRVGDRVRYLCRGGTLELIAPTESAARITWATRTVYLNGTISALDASAVTIDGARCALAPGSPPTRGLRVGERAVAFCASGRLTGINRVPG